MCPAGVAQLSADRGRDISRKCRRLHYGVRKTGAESMFGHINRAAGVGSFVIVLTGGILIVTEVAAEYVTTRLLGSLVTLMLG